MKNFLTLRLSKIDDSSETFDLLFKFENNQFTKKWQKQFLLSQQRQDPISEPWAIYGNNFWTEEKIIDQINHNMQKCNKIKPGLFDCVLTDINDQDKLNYIHSIFEINHGKLDEWLSNPLFQTPQGSELRDALSKVNQAVHRVEATSMKIRVVYFNTPKTEVFSNHDYKLFTTTQQFGGLYTLYADVGKNLEDLAEDNDQHHHDLVPNLHWSSDFVVRFSETDGKNIKKIVSNYIKDNSQMLQDKGYSTDDVRLTSGAIKLASLLYQDKRYIIDKVKQFDNIQSVFIHDKAE